jgi:hypothetical protein
VPVHVFICILTASLQLEQKEYKIKAVEADQQKLEIAKTAREHECNTLRQKLQSLHEACDKSESDRLVLERLLHQERDDNTALKLEVFRLEDALVKSLATVDNHVNR